MKWIIDRIEGDTAVCETENGGFADIKLESLPIGVKEGDTFRSLPSFQIRSN